MMKTLMSLISEQLREIADKIDAGNTNESEETLLKVVELLAEGDKSSVLSKAEACKYMNMSRATFDAHV